MKKIVTIAVLCCMTLHCAGRLGILTWIYEQRHVIAFELALIEEKPIAECGTAYLNDGLVIIQQDDDSQARPSVVFSAKEITLFCEFNFIDVSKEYTFIEVQYFDVPDHYSSGTYDSVFRPPLAA